MDHAQDVHGRKKVKVKTCQIPHLSYQRVACQVSQEGLGFKQSRDRDWRKKRSQKFFWRWQPSKRIKEVSLVVENGSLFYF